MKSAAMPDAPSWKEPGTRWVLTLWLGLAAAVALRTVARPESHSVFPLLAASAEHWWHDQPLYADYKPLDFFRYPPVFAVAVTPLWLLGLTAGGVAWVWLGMLVYAAGLWRFLRDVAPGAWTPRRTALFLALGAVGGLRGFWNGQSNALATGLLLLAASAWVRRRWWRCAWLLAGAVALKLTPLAPALLLCALRPRRLAPRLLAALLIFWAVPFLTRPPATVAAHYRDWANYLVASAPERWPGFRDGWTVWLMAAHYLAGRPGVPSITDLIDSPAYRALQLTAAVGALGWCLWQRRRCADRRVLATVTLAMGTAWLMLFGPAVEHATYVFLAPPLAWAVVQGGDWKAGRRLVVPAALLVFVLGWGGLTEPFQDAAPSLQLALPLGTALFALWLVAYTPRLGDGDRAARAHRLAFLVTKHQRVPRQLAA